MSRGDKPLWSGRISGGLDPRAWSFLHSLPHDAFLLEHDIEGTKGHVRALEAAGIVTAAQARKLLRTLDTIEVELRPDDEDVHSALERTLTERLGDLGAGIHAGRSRNDQVATDLRLYTRRAVLDVWEALLALQSALIGRARDTTDLLAPGYTHMQRAQPVTIGHWLLAHAWAFERDSRRVAAAYDAADVSPLGAGALAGNTLGLDPPVAADALGFSRTFDNTLDAVSDRDFLLDAAYACSTIAIHLSRLAEELVLWSTTEFGFVRLPDAFATGSSMMPQKRNPDVAELARGITGPVVGTLTGLLVTCKALPLAYDRDLQADKQNLRGTFETTAMALRATAGLIAEIEFDEERLRTAASDEAMLATDLAEALVRAGVPFRHAHERVASLVRTAADAGTSIRDRLVASPDALAPLTSQEAVELLDAGGSVRRRTTPGGPSPRSVMAQAGRLSRRVDSVRALLASRRSRSV